MEQENVVQFETVKDYDQLLTIDTDDDCLLRLEPPEEVTAILISTFGTITLHPEVVERKERSNSGKEQLLLSQQSRSGEPTENPMENLSSLCRLCATESEEMIPIFGSADTKTEIAKQICDCLPIVVLEIDVVSKSVCIPCQENLQMFYEFRNNVLRASKKFTTAQNAETAEIENLQHSRSAVSLRTVVIDQDHSVKSRKHCIYEEDSSDSDEFLPSNESHTEYSSELPEGKKSELSVATHECPDCAKKFVTEERLQFHKSFHKPDARPCYCSKCDKLLVSESALYNSRAQAQMNAHQRMHKDDRLFECNVCKKRFCSSEILKRHKRLHLPDKPNQYDQCGKRFDRTNGLTKHLLTHQVEAARPVACQVCGDCSQVLSEGTADAERHDNCEKSRNGPSRGIQEIILNSMYRCEFCELCYADVKSANAHKARHVGVAPYVCRICDISYATYNQATAHKAAHRKSSEATNAKDIADVPKYFTCQNCDKRFLHFTNMNIHKKNCGSGNDLSCRCCGNSFVDSKELSQHKSGVDGDEKLQCHKCSMVFGSFCALEIHEEEHMKSLTQRKVFSCSYCGKTFRQKAHLTIHVRIHTGEKPFGCDFCSKSYRLQADRDNHRRTHTGERPFKCTQCEKAFADPARLREHKKFHLDIKPYKCSICGRAFKRANGRKIHMTIHTGEKPFKCDVCDISFRRCGDMKKHKKTQH